MQPKLGERDGKTGQLLYSYLPSEELVEAVNLAIYLERPLLLKGEPGCGKTRLARAVAYELGLPYEAWNIKSTSRAKDGLY
ncbi:MAG: AAA family ATPase, partial [Coleofasciculus sp. S288]|nr:AAA family ATPase [Coleofasciculus sp. S288]